jgi:glucosamine-6-phosphate deaminase
MVIAPHPDDEIIGCGAFLLLASRVGVFNRSKRFIACATSGATGVSDEYLYTINESRKLPEEEKISCKNVVREDETRLCCASVGAEPLFFRLPFYHEGNFGAKNIEVISEILDDVKPDIIFTIDETGDPHGTHGMVRDFVSQTLKKLKFDGIVLGYRVWSKGYVLGDGDVLIGFDEEIMREKRRLLSIYKSQVLFPAYPHEKKSFVELMEDCNRELAENFCSSYRYAEAFKHLIL